MLLDLACPPFVSHINLTTQTTTTIMRTKINWKLLLTAATALAGIQVAHATGYSIDMTFDGTDITLDGGSTDPIGLELFDSDTFNLELRASNDDCWRVDNDISGFFVPLTFGLQDSGERYANIVTSFYLDGTEILSARITDINVLQETVHVGAQSWDLSSGLEFDAVFMDYELVSSTADTVISDPLTDDYFNSFGSSDRPFFRHSSISYVTKSSSVPDGGATAALLGLSLAGLLRMQRRK